MAQSKISSGFSISSFLNQEEKQENVEQVVAKADHLPENHFTETDLQTEWTIFLNQLKQKDIFVFNAIKTFTLKKLDEKTIEVAYPSDSAKSEFDKLSPEFFNHFKHKVNNQILKFVYRKDHENLKIEVMTKKKMFEKMAEKNPLLKDLDDLLKFDLT